MAARAVRSQAWLITCTNLKTSFQSPRGQYLHEIYTIFTRNLHAYGGQAHAFFSGDIKTDTHKRAARSPFTGFRLHFELGQTRQNPAIEIWITLYLPYLRSIEFVGFSKTYHVRKEACICKRMFFCLVLMILVPNCNPDDDHYCRKFGWINSQNSGLK